MSRSPERKQVRRDRAQWQQLIHAQASSGLGQRAFCDRREIAYSSFCHWKRKLEAEPSGPDSAAHAEFVELAPAGPALAEGWEVEVELGNGVWLRLRRR
jgi:hypothetical protein